MSVEGEIAGLRLQLTSTEKVLKAMRDVNEEMHTERTELRQKAWELLRTFGAATMSKTPTCAKCATAVPADEGREWYDREWYDGDLCMTCCEQVIDEVRTFLERLVSV